MDLNRYVVRRGPGEWVLEHNGDRVACFATQSAAVESARSRTAQEAAEVIVLGEDGRVIDHERRGV